jgi:hypothetical protein
LREYVPAVRTLGNGFMRDGPAGVGLAVGVGVGSGRSYVGVAVGVCMGVAPLARERPTIGVNVITASVAASATTLRAGLRPLVACP